MARKIHKFAGQELDAELRLPSRLRMWRCEPRPRAQVMFSTVRTRSCRIGSVRFGSVRFGLERIESGIT